MTYEEIASFITKEIKYQYVSYDHKLAVEDFKLLPDYLNYSNYWDDNKINSYQIPNELKEKHKVMRKGRMFDILFLRGKMYKIRIGCRYAKTFQLHDFGNKVKPILRPSEDKYDLLSRGLAVCIDDL